MIRFIKELHCCRDEDGNSLTYVEGFCLSGDTKPVDKFVTGSKLTEIDTGDVYYFDEDGNPGSEWVKPTPADSDG